MIHFGTQRIDRVRDEDNSCVRLRPVLEYLTLCGVPFIVGCDVAQTSGHQAIRAHEVDCHACLEKDSVRLPALVIEICSKGYMDVEELRDIGVPQDVIEMVFDGVMELQDIVVTVQQVTEGHFDLALPPGPKCRKCGHSPCPYCRSWCDTFTFKDGEPDEQCCDGECDFPPEEHAAWIAEITPILDEAEERGCAVVQRELQSRAV